MSVVRSWLQEPMSRAVRQAIDRLAAAPGVVRVAVMPDVHLAEHVCVGVVVGTADRLYPQAVGGDVGCGMAAVRLDGDADALTAASAAALLAALRREVPAVRRQCAQHGVLGELSDGALQRAVHRDAAIEFGTLGRGNHFLELQQDERGELWLMVHSGSRAVGPAIRDFHLARGEDVGRGLVALPADGVGRDYLRDVEVALAYAAANRREIAVGAERALAATVGWRVDWSTWFGVVHNFVRRESHDGEQLWVHRKGASSAAAAEPGIIPGSMGSASFHVTGRGHAPALASSSHGAGRALRRGEAARRFSVRDLERQLQAVFFDRGLAPRLRDEAPGAYKDIGAVMRAQQELVRIERRLRPLLCYKGA